MSKQLPDMTRNELVVFEALVEGRIVPVSGPLKKAIDASWKEAERLRTPWFMGEILWGEINDSVQCREEWDFLVEASVSECGACGAVQRAN
jgi:hypothetical protein